MHGVWENYKKTGYMGGANMGRGRGRGMRHRFDLSAMKEKPSAAKKKEPVEDSVATDLDTAADEVIGETPLVATIGRSQLAELKNLGSM
jgi:hypothetical protein